MDEQVPTEQVPEQELEDLDEPETDLADFPKEYVQETAIKRPDFEHEFVKLCLKCEQTKPASSFYKNKNFPDGHQRTCKACHLSYLKGRTIHARKHKSLSSGKLPLDLQQEHPTIRKIVIAFCDDPQRTAEDVAKEVGLSPVTVRNYCRTNDYLRAVRFIASNKMKGFVPLAVQGYKESLMSKDPDVKLRSATKLLESEKILGPAQVDVNLNDIRTKTIDELKSIIDMAKVIPAQTLSVEPLA